MNIELLKKLCETPGVPSREDRLRAVVKEALAPLVDDLTVDVMGNVIGRKAGRGKRKVMIAAHMDEIGFLVKYIDEKGFLRLQTLGGFDPRQLFAQRVLVHTAQRGALRGVLSYTAKPVHLQAGDEAKQPPRVEDFFVDLGMKAGDVKKQVEIGDMVTMDRTLEVCGENIVSKAVDNRVGIFVMIEALKMLKKHSVDIYAVATTQEEVGLRGATTSAYAIEPDVGIALDTTLANDYPGQSDADAITRLGRGAAIKIMDGSLICHPKLVAHFRDVAKKKKIPHQMEILPRGGTDGGALQRARGGSASITLSIPTRYIHTVNEMANRADIKSAIQLLAAYLAEAHARDYALE
ncbi:MAG: M42 family metallopeptidase [Kiritimatiellae bacterium]|nr:M42 family metallopeptidase [Kiritimatiellia bacterium]MCO5061690.1 M42 family metallopeptidase [Kiritimatiellia bacterium]MCO6401232.1 M42 family metallopeptidase [Verrucomicrobiota bacterium]